MRWIGIIAILGLLLGCGSADSIHSSVTTQLIPFVSAIEPSSATAGDSVSIFGFGFSAHAGANVVLIGEDAINAESYAVVSDRDDGAIESLSVTIPAGASAGEHSVLVQVFSNSSNVETLTVTP